MAITGELMTGQVQFAVNGAVSMVAGVELIDDEFGRLAMRSVTVTDPQTIAAVTGFVQQMLPTLSTELGITVTLPQGAAPQPQPEG